MFFRNLTLYRFTAETAADLARLPEALDDHRLRPCGPLELFTRGFVPPVGRGESDPLTLATGSIIAFALGGEDKILPPAVLADELHHRVQKIAEEEGRKVGGRERRRMKEDILTDLLPRAFVRSSRTSGYVDTAHGWLVIDSASRKVVEQVITHLREALGSFPAVPLAPEESPRVLMTDWLASDNFPANFAAGDECELRDPATATGAIVRARRQDLDAEEVKEHLRNGKQVFQLGLVFDDRISLVLGEDLVIRKLKFLDVVLDQLGDSAEDAQDEALGTLTLMTLELQRLFTQLATIFGLAVDAPLHLHRQDAPAGMSKHAAKFVDAMKKVVGPGGSVTITGGDKCVVIHGDKKPRSGSAREAAAKLDRMAREDGGAALSNGGEVIATFGDATSGASTREDDDLLYRKAVDVVTSTDKVSISALQRALNIGYMRASRFIDQMEEAGVVSAPDSNGLRTIRRHPTPS
jgi:recombination associated protein RdgC